MPSPRFMDLNNTFLYHSLYSESDFYTEKERVGKAVEAWSSGDLETFGKLSFESGESSIHNFEAGSPELITIHEIMHRT